MTSSNRRPPAKSAKAGDPSTAADTVPVLKPMVLRKNDTGRIGFDDRGNAIWEWSSATGRYSKTSSSQKMKRLMDSGLAIADDVETPNGKIGVNASGAKKGYDPYESGRLAKAAPPRKKDLRKLGEWLHLKNQAKQNKDRDS